MRLLKKNLSQKSSKKSFQRKSFLRKIISKENFSQRKSTLKRTSSKKKPSQRDFFPSQKKTFSKNKREILHKEDFESFEIDSNLFAIFLFQYL